jgi:hypothetical protein
MQPQAIKEAAHAQPFKPFTIHLADGREARVPAPDFMSIHPKGRLLVVFTETGGVRNIDMAMITEISFEQ